ncbi:MAG: SH3 domain-containing protein [Chloroflexi bacterium]|nr:SH3 domain-containing protein [Chloroflexota bacterium]
MSRLLLGLVCAVCCLLTSARVAAQDSYAGRVQMIRPGVELRRVNTAAWLPLTRGAVMPFGPGDALRTDGRGRALLIFGEETAVLLLPQSTYVMDALSTHDAGLRLVVTLDGQMIQRTAPDITAFLLNTPAAAISQAATLFGVWAQGADYTIATSAEGTARITAAETTLDIPPGSGARAFRGEPPSVTAFSAPWNAARLIGQLDGCPGSVRTTQDLNLNVRVGPGFASTVIGNLPPETEIRLMGVNASGNWYRVQALSGFAWVRSSLVETDCQNLPVLPGSTVENNVEVYDVQEFELAFLEPFFGAPEDNLWFYRSLDFTP